MKILASSCVILGSSRLGFSEDGFSKSDLIGSHNLIVMRFRIAVNRNAKITTYKTIGSPRNSVDKRTRVSRKGVTNGSSL